MKGALTGNAAQVLWDTDRRITDSLTKLVKVLKSRYSGERQADKYRAELQNRSRKPNESLSDLHQDIRRLMALAYPKLTADAREEIACDHFTNALSDPDLALKVNERTPETLDDALRIALRLEAWAKNVKHDRAEEDRPDRPKQKIRAAAKPEGPKPNDYFGPNDRLVKMENEVTRLQDEMKKLTTTAKPAAASTLAPVSWNSPMNPSYAGPAYPTPEAQATASAGESPLPPNGPMTGHPRPDFRHRHIISLSRSCVGRVVCLVI